MVRCVRAKSFLNRLPALAVVGLTAAGCGQRNQFQPPPPPTVTVNRPVERPVEEWVVFTGSTRAEKTVELRARVRGYLERIAFQDGASVKEGDLLFVIEKAPFEAEVAAAKASVERASAALELAQANLRRTTQLSASNAISKQQLDVDQAELATAEANLSAAKATLRQADLNLGYTEIRAPIDGRIGRHLIDVGNLVLPDQTLLAVIESTDPIQAYFNVSERDLMRIDQLAPAGPSAPSPKLEMALGDAGDFEYEGELDFSQLGIDPGTGTSLRRAVFANPEGTLVPGMFVRVRVRLGKPEPKLLVEQRALGSDQRGDFVLVVNEKNVVEYRPVELGTSADGMRVITKGLAADEWIVVNGLQRARPGAEVKPEKADGQTHVAAAGSPASAAQHGEGE
jgi:RND family efflux transporter MFP subunit